MKPFVSENALIACVRFCVLSVLVFSSCQNLFADHASNAQTMPMRDDSAADIRTRSIVVAANMLSGYSGVTNELHIRCDQRKGGFVVLFSAYASEESSRGVGAEVQLAVVEVALDGLTVTVKSTTLPLLSVLENKGDARELFVDRAVVAGLTFLQQYGALNANFVVNWDVSPGRVAVFITRLPAKPGGHTSVVVDKQGMSLHHGA